MFKNKEKYLNIPNSENYSILFSKIDLIFILILMTIAVFMYIFFHFSIFVSGDEVRYAVGFKELIFDHNQAFNYEMSFGFYKALSPFIFLLPIKEIAVFLNTIGSIAGILILIPLFSLSKSLLNSRIAFFTCLFLIFTPGYWLLSRSGHPSMLSMLFFLCSMTFFSAALTLDKKGKLGAFFSFAVIFAIAAILMRADVILWFMTPFGLAIYHLRRRTNKAFFFTAIFIVISVCLYLLLKLFFLGHLIPPSGGTILYHLRNRLPSILMAIKSIGKNLAFFCFSLLPLCFVCLFLSVAHLFRTKHWRMLALIGLWGGPMLIFLPFMGMDFSRLSVMSLPPALLSISYWIDNRLKNPNLKILIPFALLITSHVGSIVVGPKIPKLYSFNVNYRNLAISSIPINLIFADYYLRKEYLETLNSNVHEVINQTERDIFIVVLDSHFPWYQFESFYDRNVKNLSLISADNDIGFFSAQTSQNKIYFYIVKNWRIELHKLIYFLRLEEIKNAKVHFDQFLLKSPPTKLFFEISEVYKLLKIFN